MTTDRSALAGPGPLAELAAGSRRDTDPLLVCVPYAGGDPTAYLPLARSLDAHEVPVRVCGARPAYRDRPGDPGPAALDALVAALADRIADRAADAPVVVLGHSAGAPVALHLTLALEARSVSVDRLILVARLLRSTDPADHVATGVDLSEAEIVDWLVAGIGPDCGRELDPAARAELAEAFRRDTARAAHALRAALSDVDRHRVAAPATVVLARDDTLMADYPAAVGNWDLFLPQRRLVVVEHGGHYLNHTRPDLLASVVERDLAPLRPAPDGP